MRVFAESIDKFLTFKEYRILEGFRSLDRKITEDVNNIV